jgi:hypothetical protein
MAKKFRVPVKIIFEGYVIIEADKKTKASQIAKNEVDGTIMLYNGQLEEVCDDWNIGIKSTETKVGFITLEK